MKPATSALPLSFFQITTTMNNVLEQLRAQIRAVQTERNTHGEDHVNSQCIAVDRMLPDAGYARGSLVDWIAPSGCAADFLSLSVASAACQNGGALVVIDPDRQFFPSAAAAMGINMDNLIVLRSAEKLSGHIRSIGQDLLWAVDQSLRCPAVAAVWGPLPKIDDRWQRRFQLSAEASGSMGLFVRPLSLARQPSWSEVQWLVSPGNSGNTSGNTNNASGNDFGVRLNLVRCRGTHGGKSISISINTVTGSVRPARSDREQTQSIGKPIGKPVGKSIGKPFGTPRSTTKPTPPPAIASARSHPQQPSGETYPVPVVTGVAHSALGRSGT